jgi:hypothetical protein
MGTQSSFIPPIYPLTCISNLTCRLSRQDPYHVLNHRSWQDLFYILNQLNKVRHVRPTSNRLMAPQPETAWVMSHP